MILPIDVTIEIHGVRIQANKKLPYWRLLKRTWVRID